MAFIVEGRATDIDDGADRAVWLLLFQVWHRSRRRRGRSTGGKGRESSATATQLGETRGREERTSRQADHAGWPLFRGEKNRALFQKWYDGPNAVGHVWPALPVEANTSEKRVKLLNAFGHGHFGDGRDLVR